VNGELEQSSHFQNFVAVIVTAGTETVFSGFRAPFQAQSLISQDSIRSAINQ
jgi:small basic protein